jgi:hypothetical protein
LGIVLGKGENHNVQSQRYGALHPTTSAGALLSGLSAMAVEASHVIY